MKKIKVKEKEKLDFIVGIVLLIFVAIDFILPPVSRTLFSLAIELTALTVLIFISFIVSLCWLLSYQEDKRANQLVNSVVYCLLSIISIIRILIRLI